MLTKQDLIDLIDKHGLTQHKDFILEHSKPSIYLSREYVPNEDDIPIGASKVGGNPDLPADFEWQYYKDSPLTFLAQIKLSDVKPYDVDNLLPDTGWLYFFYEVNNQVWGAPEENTGALTVYVEDESTPLIRTSHPILKDEFSKVEALPPFSLSFNNLWLPQYNDTYIFLDESHPFSEVLDQYWSILTLIEKQYPYFHYLLGNPLQIQGDVDIHASFSANGYMLGEGDFKKIHAKLKDDIPKWKLLFQFDSDYHAEANYDLMFGDVGRLYFMVHKDDLRKQNFDNVWIIMQCS